MPNPTPHFDRYQAQRHALREAATIKCAACPARVPVYDAKTCDGCGHLVCLPCWKEHNPARTTIALVQ